MTIALRPFAEADRAAVVGLVHQLNLYEDAISRDRAGDLKRVVREGGAVVVACDGDIVVGMMCFVIDQPQPYLRTEIGQVGWVAELVVDERYRGQGIGTQMLEEAERLAREGGLKRLMIGAIAGNHIARKAYERFGFRPAVIELSKDLSG
jgi:GNAT superfamily N-acetyltransferase